MAAVRGDEDGEVDQISLVFSNAEAEVWGLSSAVNVEVEVLEVSRGMEIGAEFCEETWAGHVEAEGLGGP